MKTVLFILDTLETGGAEKSLLDITSHFKKYRPVFIQLFKGEKLKPLFEAKGIQVIQLNLLPSYDFNAMARQLVPVVKEIDPCIVHTTLFRSDLAGRYLKKQIDLPLVNSFVNNSYSSQRYESLSLTGKVKLFGIQLWDGWTARKADLFISNSVAIKATNGSALRVNPSKIKVIYRGRSPEAFEAETNQSSLELKKKLGVEEKKIFLNVSRLLDRKGQMDLIQAFYKLHQNSPACVLLIAGEGPYRKLLSDEIDKLKLQSSVFLLGNRDDVPSLLHATDFFVFPSHYEGLPGALIEAMFAKASIIASDIPENLECVSREMALIHKCNSVDDLADKMQQALVLSDWDQRITKAYDHALIHFSIEGVAAQYESTYDELLAL